MIFSAVDLFCLASNQTLLIHPKFLETAIPALFSYQQIKANKKPACLQLNQEMSSQFMAILAEVRCCGVWSLSLNFRLVVSQISVGDIRFHQALSYLVVLWRFYAPSLTCGSHNAGNASRKNPLHSSSSSHVHSTVPLCFVYFYCLPLQEQCISTSIHMHMVKQASSVGQIKRWRARNHPPMCQPSHHVPLFVIAHIWLQLHKNRWHECDHTLSLTIYT